MQIGKSNIPFTALTRKPFHEQNHPTISDIKALRVATASNGNEFWVTGEDIPPHEGIRVYDTQKRLDQFVRERRDGKLE
ncbi:MAG: hypothetical protein WCG23_03730 [bacterium]